jgi:hypothetical protein
MMSVLSHSHTHNIASLNELPKIFCEELLTRDCGRGIALEGIPVLALPPPPMLVLPLAPILLLPPAPKLGRPPPLELIDCLLSPSEELGREGIMALMLNCDASWKYEMLFWVRRRIDAMSRDTTLA